MIIALFIAATSAASVLQNQFENDGFLFHAVDFNKNKDFNPSNKYIAPNEVVDFWFTQSSWLFHYSFSYLWKNPEDEQSSSKEHGGSIGLLVEPKEVTIHALGKEDLQEGSCKWKRENIPLDGEQLCKNTGPDFDFMKCLEEK